VLCQINTYQYTYGKLARALECCLLPAKSPLDAATYKTSLRLHAATLDGPDVMILLAVTWLLLPVAFRCIL
jgi:hypothetical protein